MAHQWGLRSDYEVMPEVLVTSSTLSLVFYSASPRYASEYMSGNCDERAAAKPEAPTACYGLRKCMRLWLCRSLVMVTVASLDLISPAISEARPRFERDASMMPEAGTCCTVILSYRARKSSARICVLGWWACVQMICRDSGTERPLPTNLCRQV
jgi:hypothetical protein